jgi:beta-phosphoglucomutase-like phosphatase (HAD superfamily)
MALVTASSRVLVNAAIASIGFERFVATISSDDVKESKPSPEGYLKAAELIGVKISECLILEDSYVGVSAAIASGAAVIGISLSGELPKSSKLHVVPSLSNIGLPQLHEIYSRLVNA